jgi:hypothetical protein
VPQTTIAGAAREILAQRRALSAEELGAIIRERGLTRARSAAPAVSRALNDDHEARRLSDGRWSLPAALLDGAILTHKALYDPTTRPKLDALLDDMSWKRARSDGGGMDPERIRQRLGMSPGRLATSNRPGLIGHRDRRVH